MVMSLLCSTPLKKVYISNKKKIDVMIIINILGIHKN